MRWRICILSAVVLSACAPQAGIVKSVAEPAMSPPVVATPALLPEQGPFSLGDYKKTVASRIVATNEEVFFEPLPDMLKSVVVLEITIDRHGNPLDVYVIRSNGYVELEQVALASVLRAAPFDRPQADVLQGAAYMSFLETFLFRGDGFYQLLSLIPAALEPFSPSLAGASN
jgi:TonB family protein